MEKSRQDSTWDDRWMGCIFNRAHYISGNIFLKGKWLQSFYPCLLCCYQLLSEKEQDSARWMLDLNNWWPIMLWSVGLNCLVKPATLSLHFFVILLCPLGSCQDKLQKLYFLNGQSGTQNLERDAVCPEGLLGSSFQVLGQAVVSALIKDALK